MSRARTDRPARGTACDRSFPPTESRIQAAPAASDATLALSTRSRTSADSAPLTARLAISAGPRFFNSSWSSLAKPRPDSSPVPRASESPSTRRRWPPGRGVGIRAPPGAGGAAPSGWPASPRSARTNPPRRAGSRRLPRRPAAARARNGRRLRPPSPASYAGRPRSSAPLPLVRDSAPWATRFSPPSTSRRSSASGSRSRTCRSRSGPARSSDSSAPTAPARRRRSGCSWGSPDPTGAACASAASTLDRDFHRAMAHVGCIVESPDLYPYLTGRENLLHFARMLPDGAAERIPGLADLVALERAARREGLDLLARHAPAARDRPGAARRSRPC